MLVREVRKCEIKAEWRKLRGEEFHNPYFVTNIDTAIELQVIKLVGHILRTE